MEDERENDNIEQNTSEESIRGNEQEEQTNDGEAEAVNTFTYKETVYVAVKEPSYLLTILTKQPEYIRAVDKNGLTLLHVASRVGNFESVSIILKFIDDVSYVNARTSADESGMSALWLAKQGGHDAVAELLISKGGIELPSMNENNTNDEELEENVIDEAEEHECGVRQ